MKDLSLAGSAQEEMRLRIVRSWWSMQFSTSLLSASRGRSQPSELSLILIKKLNYLRIASLI
jgi:hypothetical protein